MKTYPYFPLFVDLSEKTVLVVGGGTIAKRRVMTLAEFTPHVVVVAPTVHPDLESLAAQGEIQLFTRKYTPADLEGADLVLAATDEAQLNQEIVRRCKGRWYPC